MRLQGMVVEHDGALATLGDFRERNLCLSVSSKRHVQLTFTEKVGPDPVTFGPRSQ
ncbi:hypothetical protein Tamer19_38230 [Cupriavidus sp. TA19]|nr:hypothetical protein Tamer19_38230 [Cupriavidus sp. TA19]